MTHRPGLTLQFALAAALLAGCSARHGAVRSPEAAPLASVQVEFEPTTTERRFDGTVEAVHRAAIAAQTAGRVAAIYHDVDDEVPAGALLMRLRATMQRADLGQARAQLRAAQALSAEAQTRYRRIRDMYDQRVVPKADFDRVTAERDAAAARLNAARAAVAAAAEGVAYTEIRAPYAGIVTRRRVEVGEAVAPGTPLIDVASLQDLRVDVNIPQSLADTVRRLGKARVFADDRVFEIEHVTVFPVASSLSNTFEVRLALPGGIHGLYPGMVVRAAFATGERPQLLVPESAVVARSEVTAVYLVRPDGGAVMQQVRLGERRGDRVEVLAGLTAGERVALEPLAAMRRLEPATTAAGSSR